MLLKFFAQKAIGFSFQSNDTIRYALIQQKRNKLWVEQTVEFNIHCKSALHRLQQLLKKYPSCFYFSSKNCLIHPKIGDIKSKKDQQEVVKNKVDTLISPETTVIASLGELHEKHPYYLCVRQSLLQEYKKKLDLLFLRPQKIISSLQALLSIQRKTQSFDNQALMVVSIDQLEIVHFSGKNPLSFNCFSISELDVEQIYIKIQKAIFELFKNKPLTLQIYGQSPFLSELKIQLEKISSLTILQSPKESWILKHFDYLPQIGSALSLFNFSCQGFEAIKLKNIIKIFQKHLLLHSLCILTIALTSVLFWGMQIRQEKDRYQELFSQSYAKLSKEPLKTNSSTAELIKLLKQREQQSPKILLNPNIINISDCLAWLSAIALKISKETQSSPIIFEDFKYNLVKSLKKEQASFLNQAKVHVSLIAANASIARDFYEKISQAKDFVDLSKKVEWEFHNNTYQITFFLKAQKREG